MYINGINRCISLAPLDFVSLWHMAIFYVLFMYSSEIIVLNFVLALGIMYSLQNPKIMSIPKNVYGINTPMAEHFKIALSLELCTKYVFPLCQY